jgi:amino acid transporter
MLLINYTDSIAKVFALLIEIATAATLPLYFGCTLALLVLRRRGQLPSGSPRARLPVAAAFAAFVYCAWGRWDSARSRCCGRSCWAARACRFICGRCTFTGAPRAWGSKRPKDYGLW